MRSHLDGSPCKEGTRDVPENWEPCCAAFGGHVTTCEYDVRYEWWIGDAVGVIAIAASAGGGGVTIRFCPHCGHELRPASRFEEDEPDTDQPGRRLRVR